MSPHIVVAHKRKLIVTDPKFFVGAQQLQLQQMGVVVPQLAKLGQGIVSVPRLSVSIDAPGSPTNLNGVANVVAISPANFNLAVLIQSCPQAKEKSSSRLPVLPQTNREVGRLSG